MNRHAQDDSFAMIVAETATVGCLLLGSFFWPLLLVPCLGAALLWSATWLFSAAWARLARVLRTGLVAALVPLPVLFCLVSALFEAAWLSTILWVAAIALSSLALTAWAMTSSLRLSREARRRGQSVLSVAWILIAFVLLPVGWLPLIFFPHPLLVFLVGFAFLALRSGLGIATAIAWRPRSARKDRGVMRSSPFTGAVS